MKESTALLIRGLKFKRLTGSLPPKRLLLYTMLRTLPDRAKGYCWATIEDQRDREKEARNAAGMPF